MSEDIRNATYTLFIPEKSECKCYMFGSCPDGNGLVYHPNKDNEPNWFWRKMQFLILGNKWVKNERKD